MSLIRLIWPFFDVEDDDKPGKGPKKRKGTGAVDIDVIVDGVGVTSFIGTGAVYVDVIVDGVGLNDVITGTGTVVVDVVVAAVGQTAAVPVYTGPPITSAPSSGGGSQGGWGGSVPHLLRARLYEIEEKKRKAAALPGLFYTSLPSTPQPPLPRTSTTSLLGAGFLGALLGSVFLRREQPTAKPRVEPPRAEPRVEPRAEPWLPVNPEHEKLVDDLVREHARTTGERIPLPRRNPATETLPVAEGRATGRTCFVCRQHKSIDAFHGNARKCDACKAAGAQRSFSRECVVCERTFLSPSTKALTCSQACRETRARWLRLTTDD